MTRTLTGTLRSATDTPDSFFAIAKATVAPSRIFFDTITSDNPISGSDGLGLLDDPLRQDIEYSAIDDGLVTFWGDTDLKYAIQGSGTITTTVYTCDAKPGVLGSKIYVYDGTNIKRYSINWSSISSRSTNPLSDDSASIVPSLTVRAVHALSDTEYVYIAENNGGLSAVYVSGTTQNTAPLRFMFPKRIDWEGSARTLQSMAVFSGALKLGTKIFVYLSNASIGTVEGISYDTTTGQWSDIFTALPTDLEVSLCEFRIANAYERNGTAYLVGQFSRTDAYTGSQPYTLILYSENGKTFSIDRFTLVSDVGYRFLARVGSDNELYLGNSNRVCYAPVTWVFDGKNGTAYTKVDLTADHILSFKDTDLTSMNMVLKSGQEEYFDSTSIIEGARVQLYTGLKTTGGDEFVLWGTYIINSIQYSMAQGNRGNQLNCVNETAWRLGGLSMPFYAEIFGKSCIFDPMNSASGKLYSAPSGQRTATKFYVDFWKHEAYTNTAQSITGINMTDAGGVGFYQTTAAHKLGIITSYDLKDIMGLQDNPLITGTSLTVKIHGWCHPLSSGQTNDEINLILETEDENGVVTTTITNAGKKWKQTWPDTAAGEEPISISVGSMTAGHRIKRVGIVFWNSSNGSWFNIGRVEFVDNVEVPFTFEQPNTPWTVETDGTFKVPAGGRPFIMFAQKPYNAWNFSLNAFFENTMTGGITGYATAGGLIGHAEDASNYICGRYDKTANKVQIVSCRNGIETVKASVTPGFTISDLHGIQFRHKEGTYYVDMWHDTNLRYENVASYSWQASDGFMYTSRTATMKCGIYGNIESPVVRILGYYAGVSEDTVSADGIPVDPLYDLTDFPTSGTLRIGDNTYAYSSKVNHPTVARGPYQFRQANIYSPPFGNGSAGMEVRDFDWNASTSLLNGKLIASNSGSNFIANGALWRVWTTTGGVVSYQRNRARYYSANNQIAKIYHTLAHKIWITGGFTGITLISGNATKHPEGKVAALSLEGEIKCRYFSGAGGMDDTTIADLIERIANLSGGKTNFVGDYTNSSIVVSGSTDIYTDYYAEGFDLQFNTASAVSYTIETNIKVNPENYENGDDFDTDTGLYAVVTSAGSGVFYLQLISQPSGTQLFATKFTTGTGAQAIRALFHENYFTLYHNSQWIATVCFDELIYDQTDNVDINVNGSFTMSNVLVRELSDWREAIYIDLETDGKSAIGSVLQQRPVESWANPDGSLSFSYDPTRTTITAQRAPIHHSWEKVYPTDGASDAIVYGAKEVVTMQSAEFAKALGFSTKLMRVPDMNVGSIEAAQRLLTKSYQSREKHNLEIRPDFSLIPGDKYTVSYNASGTGKAISATIILERVTLSMSMTSEVSARMGLTGRKA